MPFEIVPLARADFLFNERPIAHSSTFMLWRFIFSGSILVSLLGVASCSPESGEVEVSGQVFLVMPDGDNQLLSLVAVQVYDRDTMMRFMEGREAEIRERREALAQREAERRQGRDAAVAERDAAETRYRERREEIAREAEALERDVRRRVADHLGSIRQNEAFIIDLTEIPQPPEGIPTREEYQAFSERRERWFSMNRSEREAWREALRTQNGNLEEAIDAIESAAVHQREDWDTELANLRLEFEQRHEAVREAETPLAEAVAAREAFPSVMNFFQDLPEFTDMFRTDANGEFALTLPRGTRKALVAMVDREIRGERERHGWILWIDTSHYDGRKLLLSNHNALTWDDLEIGN